MDRHAAAPPPAADDRERSALAGFLALLNADCADRWADALLAEFGSLGCVMAQSREAAARAVGSVDAAAALEAAGVLTRAWLREQAWEAPVLGDRPQLMDYLRAQHAFAADEWLRVLFLNSRNLLMRDEALWQGTLDRSPFWPRLILRRGLELNAAGLILVHNHPSGDHAPSSVDVQATQQLCLAARSLDMYVHDHLIFSSAGCSSLRQLGLL